MVGRWNGEFKCRGAARLQSGQISATPARVLCIVVEIRIVRQVVRLHWQG